MGASLGTVASRRIVGIDLARAIAIVGMMVINYNESIGSSDIGPGWLAWLAELIPGRAAVTFVLLAGIGMSLMAQGARLSGNLPNRKKVQTMLFRRSSALFIFGLLFQLIWEGDILHFYGVFIALGTLLLFAPSIWLCIIVLLLNAGFTAMLFVFDYSVGWNWDNLGFTDFWTLGGFIRNLIFNGWFPIFPWLGFLLAGIWMGRLNLRSGSIRRRCIFWGGTVALSAEAASWVLTNHIGPRWLGLDSLNASAFFGRNCLPPNPLFALQAGAGGIFMISLSLELAEKLHKSSWFRPVALLGQYTLSLYVGHIILGIIPLLCFGYTDMPLAFSISAGLVAVVVSIILCSLWQRHFTRGPLEMALRRFSNGKP
jgi:uncharacterized protein